MEARRRGLTAATLTVVSLFAVALAILVLANEVRYQGCVSRIDQVNQTNALASKPAGLAPPECSRLPFGA